MEALTWCIEFADDAVADSDADADYSNKTLEALTWCIEFTRGWRRPC